MTKTLVERLLDHGRPATETQDRYTIRRNEERAEAAAEITRLASRIEELERAQTGFRLALADVAVQADRYEREEIGGQELADTVGFTARQALSEPSPATPVKRLGAARYLEG